MLLAAALLWGSGNVANKTILQDVDPWSAVFLCSLMAAAVLLPFALADLRRGDRWPWLRSCAVPSVLFALALGLEQMAYVTATVTNGSFLLNAACVLTPAFAFICLGDRASPSLMVAAVAMLVGAFVISGADLSAGALNLGDKLCLLSAAAYAGWAVALGRQAMRHGRPAATTFLHCVTAAVLALPFATTVQAADGPRLLAAMPEVLYLGVLSTACALLLIIAAQSRVSASVAVLLTGVESLFGAAGGILVLGEVPSRMTLLGAFLILSAVGLVALGAARSTIPARAGVAG